MEYNVQEVSKEEYIDLFKWLFGSNIQIKEEPDIALSPYYEDINIYYTQEIYDLFQTVPMKREGKIMQLGSQIFCNPNVYHTRLEHSKGAYRNCMQFLAIQFRKPEWRNYIEENRLKGYLVEKIKFMCVHDIGHSMFSHSIEKLIGNKDCNHEDIGQKIIQENEEIKNALQQVKTDEQNSNLQGDGSLEFLCEGNIDFDRMDFLMRDRLHIGEEHTRDLILILNSMTDLKYISEEERYQYVYRPEALPYIEEFLTVRDNMYKTHYQSKQRKITDQLASRLVETIKEGNLKNTEKLQKYLEHIVGKDLEELDIGDYLKTNDILFLNQLMGAMDELNDNEMLQCIMPSNQALLQVAISLLNPKNTSYSEYNEEEKEFIINLRKVIAKRKNDSPKKLEDIVLSIETKTDEREKIKNEIHEVLGIEQDIEGIYSYKSRFRKYNNQEPIYIENREGEIYTLDKFPDLQMDLSDDYQYGVYIILPELKEQGIQPEKINQMQRVIDKYQIQEETIESDDNLTYNRMNLFRTEHGGINYDSKWNQFFGEERE